jgi:uncharacterized membrane protein YdjX (TVP38/TMEM64 family)
LTRKAGWVIVGLAFIAAVVLYQYFDLGRLLTLDNLKASREALVGFYEAQPLLTTASFFGIYVLAAAMSIPGALILTLAAGVVFGFGVGLLVVSFASSLGALLAFLASRYLLRETIQARFGKSLAPINDGVKRDGTFYLLTLRLVPVFPFWLINLLMGLTPIRAGRFYLVSQIGMLAGTAVYVNAGTQLATIRSPGDILSPGLVASFVLLGVFPLIGKGIVGWIQRRKALCEVAEAEVLRPQPCRDRRRVRRTGVSLHRCDGQGQGDADRGPQDGRRLPELRLRAEQGVDPLSEDGQAPEDGSCAGDHGGSRHGRLRRRHGTCPPRHRRHRAARLDRALHVARC